MSINHLTVDAYINTFPKTTQALLQQVRVIIQENAVDAVELISYGMPAYKLKGKPLVYFAGYKNHIGLYATPNTHEKFKKELSIYKQGKGSVQFPLNEPLPAALIKKMLQFKMKTLV
jgi:uncharacterized protein YdhG (YjbR/CyaY superfamily)